MLQPTLTGTLAQALQSNQDFRVGSVEVDDNITAQSITTRHKLYESASNLRVYFDKDKNLYIVANAIGSREFPPGYVNASGNPYVGYGWNSTDGVRRFRLLNPIAGNSRIALTYASFGVWQFDSTGRASITPETNNEHFFYFGIPTAAADMPRSGTAEYRGIAEGVLHDRGTSYDLTGTTDLSANFSNGSLVASLLLNGVARNAAGSISLPMITADMTIAAGTNRFEGSSRSTDDSFVGSIRGAFFGPAAQEFGYSFAINSPDLTRIGGGVAVGKR